MKKLILVLMLLPFISYGQDYKNIIGLRGGPTFTTMEAGYTKYSIGGFYTRKLGSFQLTFEPSMNKSGYLYNSKYPNDAMEYNYTSFQLSTSFGYYIDKKVIAGIYAGFNPGYVTNHRYSGIYDTKNSSITLSLFSGISLGYNFSDRVYIYSSLRYVYGIGERSYIAPLLFLGYKF
jgi:hypothetical protein